MKGRFSEILDEFKGKLKSVGMLIELGANERNPKDLRLTTFNSVTLVLAATFEEYIRQMAKEHVRLTVYLADSISDLPSSLLEAIWVGVLKELSGNVNLINSETKEKSLVNVVEVARPKFEAVCNFFNGDLQQEVFNDIIHNESNMRSGQINRLFRIGGTTNICSELCEMGKLKLFFNIEKVDSVHGHFNSMLEDFFEKRNLVAHSINESLSLGRNSLSRDIEFFLCFGQDLADWLERRHARTSRKM